MKIVLTPTANQDIEHIYNYIAKNNTTSTAKKILNSIENMIDHLEKFSELGKIGRIRNTRELTIPKLPFIIVYKIYKTHIAIVSIMHTSKKW